MDIELKKIVKWAESQGWECRTDASGHTQFYDPAGTHVTGFGGTPSSQRGWANLKSALKRAGLPWPPPSKKEQRSVRRKDQQ